MLLASKPEGLIVQPVDFFRSRIDAMINLSDPLAVLASRLPWDQIQAAIAAKFVHLSRAGKVTPSTDLFGEHETVVGAGRSNAGRPRLDLRLMVSLLAHQSVCHLVLTHKGMYKRGYSLS